MSSLPDPGQLDQSPKAKKSLDILFVIILIILVSVFLLALFLLRKPNEVGKEGKAATPINLAQKTINF